MFDLLKQIRQECIELIESCDGKDKLNDIRVNYLGKSGKITSLMRHLKEIPNEKKPEFGKKINEVKDEIETIIRNRFAVYEQLEVEKRLKSEKIDITLDLENKHIGAYNPLSIVKQQIMDIFVGMGFSVAEGPEIETDYFNFEALNIPADHPAREMQDTFYITDKILLRTHTSPMQARTMQSTKPPIRIIVPGKVYRSDDDATHSPMFQQIEGLVVDKNITLCDLKGVLELFAKSLFNEDTKVRFRPSYFPFTEPSVEVDVSCAMCHGKGCRLCKGTGWIEILGAGVVNPAVLKMSGIDPDVYSGFAFGLGIERITMIKYGIPDMRIMFENDVRYLKQFAKEDK